MSDTPRKMASQVQKAQSCLQKAWKGRAGPIPWPPRSPDLTPCDLYLQGHVKDQVYQAPMSQSLQALQ
jgi:hypothetical protein